MRNVMITAVVARIVDQIVDRAMVAAVVFAHALRRHFINQHLGQLIPSMSSNLKPMYPSTYTWRETLPGCSTEQQGFGGRIGRGCSGN